VLEKTGCNRQADIVALLTAISPARLPHPAWRGILSQKSKNLAHLINLDEAAIKTPMSYLAREQFRVRRNFMANSYQLMDLSGLFMDVYQGIAKPSTPAKSTLSRYSPRFLRRGWRIRPNPASSQPIAISANRKNFPRVINLVEAATATAG
jgi:hypothetical protein